MSIFDWLFAEVEMVDLASGSEACVLFRDVHRTLERDTSKDSSLRWGKDWTARGSSTMKALSLFSIVFWFAAASLVAQTVASPVVPVNGVVNGASFASGMNALAPGSIATILGSNLDDGSSNPSSNFGSDGKLLTALGGASVTFNGILAPILASFPGQLNVEIPLELSGATSAAVVVTVGGQSSAPQTVLLGPLSPGIFSLNNQGTGPGAIQIANTNIYAAAAGSIPGAQAQPASPGDFITIYCTGLGAVSNAPATGMAASGNPLSTAAATPLVTIGDIPAAVSFTGMVPGFVGLYQVNAQVPVGVPVGNAVPVVLSVGQKQSNTVTMATAASGNLESHFVDLMWTASTSPNILGYNIYRSDTSGGPYSEVNTTLVVGFTYTDTAVLAGQIYYYVATAVNTANLESGYSTQVQVPIPSR